MSSTALLEKKPRTPSTSTTKDVTINLEVADLIEKCYRKCYDTIIVLNSPVTDKEFALKERVELLSPNNQELVKVVHQEILRRLQTYNSGYTYTDYYLVPTTSLEEIQRMTEKWGPNQPEEFFGDTIPAEWKSLSTADFISTVNIGIKSTEQHDKSFKAARKMVDNNYKKALDPTSPNNFATFRKNILELFLIDHPEVMEKVLISYIDLCESDPITKESSNGLVDCLTLLISWSKDNLITKLDTNLQILLAESFALTLECLLLHMGANLSAQKQEIKKGAEEGSASFEQMNIHHNTEMTYWSNYALEASKMIQVESSEKSEVIKAVVELVQLGLQIGQAVAAPSPSTIIPIITTAKGIADQIQEKLKKSSTWFKNALMVKKSTRLAIYDHSLFRKLMNIYRNVLPIKGKEDQHKIFCYLDNLEMAIVKSKNEKVRIDALKLVVHFIFIDHEAVKYQAVKTLKKILEKDDVKLQNTCLIVLELIKRQYASSKKYHSANSLTQDTRPQFHQIVKRSDFYPQVIQYLMLRSLDIRFEEDFGGIPLINLLPYSTKPTDRFLDVFSRIPAIATNFKDVRGNTPWHHAVKAGNTKFIKTFEKVAKGNEFLKMCTLHMPNVYGDYPIHVSVEQNDVETLKLLLKLQCSPNEKNGSHQTPLHLAVEHRHIDPLIVLCKQKGVEFQAMNGESKTPLILAIETGFIPGVDALSSHEPAEGGEKKGITPLMMACLYNQWDVVAYYLARSDISALEMNLMLRKLMNSTNNVFLGHFLKLVMTNRSFYDLFMKFQSLPHPRIYDGTTVLFDPTKLTFNKKDDEPLIVQLVHNRQYDDNTFDKNNYDPNQEDVNGLSLLMLLALDAQKTGDCVKKIIGKGGDPFKKHASGISPLLIGALFESTVFPTGISYQIRYEPNLAKIPQATQAIRKQDFTAAATFPFDVTDSMDSTPLMEVARYKENGAYILLETMLATITQVNTPNHLGLNAMHIGCLHSNIRYLTSLCAKGGDLESTTSQGYRCVHIAAFNKDIAMLDFLIEQKAQFDVENHFKETPLHIFCGVDLAFEPTVLQTFSEAPRRIPSVTDNLRRVSSRSIDVRTSPKPLRRSPSAQTPMERSSIQELDTLQKLVKLVDLKKKDAFGNTVLHRVVLYGNPDFIPILLKACPDLFWIENLQGKIPIELMLGKKLKGRDFERLSYFNLSEITPNFSWEGKWGESVAHLCAAAKLLSLLKSTFRSKVGLAHKVNPNNGQSPLHEAAKSGFVEMLELYTNLNVTDNQGHTPLHYAALYGQLPFIQALLKRDDKLLKSVNNDGRSALHLAAQKGEVDVVKYFIETLGMAYDEPDHSGEIPIHIATRNGHRELVQYFYKLKPQLVTATNDEGFTVLHIAAITGNEQILCDLLQNDIEPSSNRQLELIISLDEWHSQSVQFKPVRQLQVNQTDISGHSPLFLSCLHGKYLATRVLLLAGASIYLSGELQETPLHVACFELQYESVRSLLEFMETHLEYKLKGETILGVPDAQNEALIHEVCKKNDPRKRVEQEKILSLLIKAKSPVNPQDEEGRTPLHVAIREGNHQLVKSLYRVAGKELSLSVETHEGDTPLHYAAYYGDMDCMRALLFIHENLNSLKNQVNKKNHDGNAPLALAVQKGHYYPFILLKNSGGNLKVLNKKKQNLYHILFLQRQWTLAHRIIFKFLLDEYPEGLRHVDDEGDSCLHILARDGRVTEADVLLNYLKVTPKERDAFLQLRNKSHQLASDVATPDFLSFLTSYTTERIGSQSISPDVIEALKTLTLDE